MAGNIQADNSGNILVEFDYNNIIVVDPNKTIDDFGNIKERLVDHEKLVMYANLEAELLPRTKLAVGGSPQDRIRTISVAKINFLKPTKNTYLGVGYYDELTGKDSLQKKGANQPKVILNTNSEGESYIRNTVVNEGNIIDNGLLGITQINITTNSSFVPSVQMELEDVQGKALFQLGNDSPYAAFFNLPYPQFYLTIKGYYGQAIRYQLNLEKFNARFNSFSGNYQVSLQFRGYKFNILNEIAMGHLLAAPHMYGQTFTVANNPDQLQTTNSSSQLNAKTENKLAGSASNSQDNVVTKITSERGYQKIREVYSEYKAKGLISPNLPELTLIQLMNKLENFENFIINSYPKANLEPLTNIRTYKENLQQYYNKVRGSAVSWFNKYMDPRPIVLESGDVVYFFKKNFDEGAIRTAISELEKDVTEFNKLLDENPTLGKKGLSPIKNDITFDTLQTTEPLSKINWVQTTIKQTGILQPTSADTENLKINFNKIYLPAFEKTSDGLLNEVKPKYFIFEGINRFDKKITSMETQANKKLSEYETAISADLARRLEDSATGIGFKPTVRNMIAVIMASAEAFIRLMDDVHTNAWNVKYDPVRKRAIQNNISSAQSSDSRDDIKLGANAQNQNGGLKDAEEPVYPWPQFFVETPEDKKGRFQLKYIADPSVVDLTQGYLYEKWPEVEFVEEYMKGLTNKFNPPLAPEPLDNQQDTNQININAIEYPQLGISYLNKEEVKFFYEIWERQFLTSHYSGMVRAVNNQVDELIKLVIETEVNNIKQSLGVSTPYLTFKLKNLNITAQNYVSVLENISNQGTGKSYQEFLRDLFVTPYIRTITENSFSILGTEDLGKIPQVSPKSTALSTLVKSSNNTPLIVDTIPFTDPTWVSKNMADSVKSTNNQVYNTNQTLKVFQPKNIIANFSDVYNFNENRPVTNFSYTNVSTNPTPTNLTMTAFYLYRDTKQFIPTEGYTSNITPTNAFSLITSTSMLNTPFFINAIQNGVYSQRRKDPYPYVQAAYLFLNSLPLASLRERYKTKQGDTESELDYIASVFKKYGAIHKIPYAWVLKFGSVWHRYKKYKETNVDILDTAWKNFDYVTNYSPVLSSATQTYSFQYNQQPKEITLQSETQNTVSLNVGFYPKVITDFNYFYSGFDVFAQYTNEELQKSVNRGMRIFNYSDSNITGVNLSGKTFNETTYSVLVPDLELSVKDSDCNPKNNSQGLDYFVIPSFGTYVNQGLLECVTSLDAVPTAVVPLKNNPNIYNGSVRTLWAAPNYGYFDADQVVKPQPDSYINRINEDQKQAPFRLLNNNSYSKIEEIFSVFEKKILDQFEQEFLNFSKPATDTSIPSGIVQFNESNVSNYATFRNFQGFFKSLMTVPSQSKNTTDSDYFNGLINTQLINFSNSIRSFLEYDVILRYGNPSNYKRRIFDSYLSHNSAQVVQSPITFESYVPNTLPSLNGGITLQQSKILNPKAWFALETEVGFSTIENVEYSNNGSYITDFFIDNNIKFNEENVTILAPLVKMYATQKLLKPGLNATQFKTQLNSYLTQTNELQSNFLNQVLNGIRAKGVLPDQQFLPERTIQTVIDGQQSKVENYEIFKALNDKWIAGANFTEKTLFEDMMFLDRASRNIGDTILIDIFDLKNMFSEKSLNQAMSVFTFISGILIKNNFTVMNLPAYVNFYNVQDVDGTTIPQPEGSLDFANSMWGTFLDVDYRKSGPKMVCFYVGKPSQYLDLPKGNFRFRDDGFEMRRASDNPLLENLQGKKDWAVSNKCVGFNVDIGTRNQNIFYSFSVTQDSGKATSESINTQINMVDQANGRNTATQNVSLYNFYKNRSYQCQVVCLGNALIQPTMYFNLRHVPMFYGPYMILEVQHSISAGQFQTSFNGIRQGTFDLPSIDNFLQQVNQNLLTRLQELVKTRKNEVSVSATTDNVKSTQIVQNSKNTKAEPNSCVAKLNPYYAEQTNDRAYISKTAVVNGVTPSDFANIIRSKIPENPNLRVIIYCISYVRTFQKNANTKVGNFNVYDNNFATITLTENLSPTDQYFQRTYSCVNLKPNDSYPVANFESPEKFLDFMISRLTQNTPRILQMGLLKYYVCYWPQNFVSEEYFDQNINQYKELKDTLYEAYNSAINVGLITKEEAQQQANVIELNVSQKSDKKPNVTPTPSPVPPNPGQTCPPPIIYSLAPLSGNTGTIIQINGKNLLNVSGITINNTTVPQSGITIYNDSTIRVSVPKVGTGDQLVTGNIILKSQFGNSSPTNQSTFTFNPALPPAAASSPGSYSNNASGAGNNSIVDTNTPPNPFVVTQNTKNLLGSSETLTVNISTESDIGIWKIIPQVSYNYEIFQVTVGPNNTKLETSRVISDGNLVGYVSDDRQKFSISSFNFLNNELKSEIEAYKSFELKISVNIILEAVPEDKVKYPNNKGRNFNFIMFVPSINVNEPGQKTFPKQSLSIVRLPDSGSIQGEGWSYFNIKKSGGGYIPFRFILPPDSEINTQWIESVNVYKKGTSESVPVNREGGPDTKYTYVMTVNAVGPLVMEIIYFPYGFTSPSDGQVLKQTVISPVFTL